MLVFGFESGCHSDGEPHRLDDHVFTEVALVSDSFVVAGDRVFIERGT